MKTEETRSSALPGSTRSHEASSSLPSNAGAVATLPGKSIRKAPSPEEGAEIARRGWELYETKIRAQVEPEHLDRFLVIDVDTEEYRVSDTNWEAANQLIAKNIHARLYGTRVGSKTMYKI